MKARFFRTQEHFRAWLEENHATVTELWIGYYKRGSGKGGLTYRQALDEALCFGWIDGVVKRIDEISYMQRWTPRTRTSIWSNVNTKRYAELKKMGLVAPPGGAAYRNRAPARSGVYTYERRVEVLAPEFEKALRAVPGAWDFLQAQPPGYKRLAIGWVMHAKKEDTRVKRFTALLAATAAGKRVRWM